MSRSTNSMPNRIRAAGLPRVAVLLVALVTVVTQRSPFLSIRLVSAASSTKGTTTTTSLSRFGGSSSTSLDAPPPWWQRRWHKAAALAALEQSVEDYNADWIAQSRSVGEALQRRRLICLPLNDGFDPPPGVFSHRHIQTGDKISLPSNFWPAIQVNRAEVPWLFRIQRVDGVTGRRVEFSTSTATSSGSTTSSSTTSSSSDDTLGVITECQPLLELDAVVAGPLDFRAPPNYVFVPWWMMRALGLKPRDVVEVEQIETIPPGSLAKLRPHSSDFARDIGNPQAVLETELRHYSSLTQGSTIAFDYNQKRYWFDVVELRSAPRGAKVPVVKVQDCDIATDFLIAKDVLLEQKKRKREKLLLQQRQSKQ